MKWLVLILVAGSVARGEPSESVLANRVETQAEVAVGQTNFTPPVMSRFSILVAEALESNGNASAQLLEAAAGGESAGPFVEYTGDRSAAITLGNYIAASPSSTLIPLQALEGSPQIVERATTVVESVRLLNLAMDKTSGQGSNAFLTMSAKAAVVAWNQLVNTLMDRMDSLYREPVPDTRQWQLIRDFLMDPKTIEYRGVLASFFQQKTAH